MKKAEPIAAGSEVSRWGRIALSSIWNLAAVLCGAVMMSWPAIWNGFPLIYPDSMTYIGDGPPVARAVFLHQLSGYYGMRSFIYSLGILPFHWNVTPWPVVGLQALLAAYVLWLVIRVLLPANTARNYLLLVAFLSIGTSLSWYVTLILPDILGPLLYLAIFLLVFAGASLTRVERWSLYPIAWWGITSHATHLMLAAGICLLLLLALCFRLLRRHMRTTAVAGVLATLAVAAGTQLALNGYLYGHPSLNGERPPFLTARLIADGPGRWYLQKHCDETHWVICKSLDHLPDDPDNFLWAPDGIWQNLADGDDEQMLREEMPFAIATIRAYPGAQLSRSAANFWGQLTTFGLDDLDPSSWVLEQFDQVIPASKASYLRGRQARDALPLDEFTSWQAWVVVGSLAVIAAGLVFAGATLLGRRRNPRLLALTALIGIVVVANASVTGTLSLVEDRLQSRVVWLLPLLAGLFLLDGFEQWQASRKNRPAKELRKAVQP